MTYLKNRNGGGTRASYFREVFVISKRLIRWYFDAQASMNIFRIERLHYFERIAISTLQTFGVIIRSVTFKTHQQYFYQL